MALGAEKHCSVDAQKRFRFLASNIAGFISEMETY